MFPKNYENFLRCIEILSNQNSCTKQKVCWDPQLNQLSDDLLKHLQAKFKTNLIALVFYGSRVRGDNVPESDLDILIVLQEFDERESRLISTICGELTRKYFIKVSPYVVAKSDFEYGCKYLFPFNLGVYLANYPLFGKEFIEQNHKYISDAIIEGRLIV